MVSQTPYRGLGQLSDLPTQRTSQSFNYVRLALLFTDSPVKDDRHTLPFFRPERFGMRKEEFLDRIRAESPADLAWEYLTSASVCLFGEDQRYAEFRARVSSLVPAVDRVAVVGSGNWRYSLNPHKGFREFCSKSDVDVAIVSTARFQEFWEEMRRHHRTHFYTLPPNERERIRRNGENVYSGFISPAWIPNRDSRRSYEYHRLLDSLSDRSVGFLKVKMMFFKNDTEAVDYYARGFWLAKKGI
jgi:hypothetical protein